MMRSHADYTRVPFSRARRAALDLSVAQRTHLISGLIEADVTDARALMHTYEAATGEALSFTAFITGCVARAVDEHKLVQAYRRGRSLIVFDDVDVTVLVEQAGASPNAPTEVTFHIVRAANRKPLPRIHHEIRAAQSAVRSHASDPLTVRVYDALPGPVRRLLIRIGKRSPVLWKQFGGTVAVTAVGMLGTGGGWGIPITCNTLAVTIGGIGEQPRLIDGRLASREFLDLTITADHDVVDGAPAARFASRLRELVERAYGIRQLVDSLPSAERGLRAEREEHAMQLPQLLEFVQRRIHEGAGIAVHVSEEDGCVVLSGTVPSDAVGKRIQTIAQQTLDELAPATLLVNNLDLDPTGFPWDAFPPDHTSDHAGKGEAHEGESLALGSDGAG